MLGPEVWTREHAYRWGGRDHRQHERFFLVPTERFEPNPHGMPDPSERDGFLAYRWWALDDLCESSERFAPRRLGALLKELLDAGSPAEPVDVGA